VSFGATPPQFPIRGHFFWDGVTLFMWDGVEWQDIGPTAPSAGGGGITDAPTDGQIYARQSGQWVVIPQAIQRLMVGYYTTSQVITIPAGASQGLVQMWGATGGSGGVTNGESAGSGAGGYLEKLLTGITPGLTINYTQGTGGTAGAAAGAGGAGTPTTLVSGTQTIGTLTCNSSTGSGGSTGPTPGQGSIGGSATGGDVNIQGGGTWITNGENVNGGSGITTFYSRGADGVTSNGSIPGNAGNPGGLKITWVIL
jgi:hypothetical protein